MAFVVTYLEAQLADGLAVQSRLLRSSWRGQLDAVDAEVVEGLCDLELRLTVEEGSSKLLTLSQRRLNDLEVGDVGEQVRCP